jgi:hypothetical protein
LDRIKRYNNFLILEKTTLTTLGVPIEVARQIEKDYAFSNTVEWKKVSLRELLSLVYVGNTSGEFKLFIQRSASRIIIFTAIEHDDHKVYLCDEYTRVRDDFGEGWVREERDDLTLGMITKKLVNKKPIYYLESGEFKLETRKARKLEKREEDFDELTNKFKKDVIKYLTKYEIDWVSKDGSSTDTLDDIERTLIEFEHKISQRRKRFIQLPDIIELYGYDKTKISFLYFLKTGKLKF